MKLKIALKNWRDTKDIFYRHRWMSRKGTSIYMEKKNGKFLVQGYYKDDWDIWVKPKIFDTEKKAMNFMKAYMKKH